MFSCNFPVNVIIGCLGKVPFVLPVLNRLLVHTVMIEAFDRGGCELLILASDTPTFIVQQCGEKSAMAPNTSWPHSLL